MTPLKPFHLIYVPAQDPAHEKDRIIGLLQTDDVNDVLLKLRLIPDSIAMLLDAFDLHEAAIEMQELGFA